LLLLLSCWWQGHGSAINFPKENLQGRGAMPRAAASGEHG